MFLLEHAASIDRLMQISGTINVGWVAKGFQTQFQAYVNRNEWVMWMTVSFGCVARAAVSEHRLNHELMNDSSKDLAEVNTIRERPIYHFPLSKLKRVFITTWGSEVNGGSHASLELHKNVHRQKVEITTAFLKIFNFLKLAFLCWGRLAPHSQS